MIWLEGFKITSHYLCFLSVWSVTLQEFLTDRGQQGQSRPSASSWQKVAAPYLIFSSIVQWHWDFTISCVEIPPRCLTLLVLWYLHDHNKINKLVNESSVLLSYINLMLFTNWHILFPFCFPFFRYEPPLLPRVLHARVKPLTKCFYL